MDIATIGKIVIANAETAKVMNGNAVVWQANTVPGPTKLIGGNLQAGFYGEVPAKDFITGDKLVRRIGLTAGTSQFSNEPWLKFSYMGKVEFVAKKPFRNTISWNQINAVNAVFGNKTININGLTFKVRLMKGKTEGEQSDTSADYGDICKNSEWNRLMLPIHINAPSNWAYSWNVNSPTANWNIGYTDRDLVTKNTAGYGSYCWCQECGDSKTVRLFRGDGGVSSSGSSGPSAAGQGRGWRPVLELVD